MFFKIKKIIKCFSEDLTASSTARILGINRNTINTYYDEFRKKLLLYSIEVTKQEYGEFELDESYFGAKRIRGKRGRGAAGKTPVFGLLKRNGKGSTIHTDGWRAYDGLILNGYTHHRVFHNENEFARGKSHVNGIESFWSFAKRRLAKFNGLTDEKFILHLKESEVRFNYRHDNFYNLIEKIFFEK